MTDLTNKVDKIPLEEMQVLYTKYAPLLELIKQRKQIPYLAYIFDLGITYTKEKYKNVDNNWLQWAIVCLKELHLKGKLSTEEDIHKVVDEFIEYCKNNYHEHINDNAIHTDAFNRDWGFVHKFMRNKY